MRELAPDGLCPVADKAPELWPCNEIVHDIFLQAEGTAEKVDGDRKLYLYLKPTEIEALMRIHEIENDEKQEIFYRLLLLQDITNSLRPNRPKPKKFRR